MELGAIVCVPNGEPLCDQCPGILSVNEKRGTSGRELPVKRRQKGRRIEERTVLVIRDGERVVLKRRPKKGLLAGLYEFPNEPGTLTEDEALRAVQDMHLHPMRIQRLEEVKTYFSHVEWHMQVHGRSGFSDQRGSRTVVCRGGTFGGNVSDPGGICGLYEIYEHPAGK